MIIKQRIDSYEFIITKTIITMNMTICQLVQILPGRVDITDNIPRPNLSYNPFISKVSLLGRNHGNQQNHTKNQTCHNAISVLILATLV